MSVPINLFTTRSLTDANAPATDGVAVSGTPTIYSDIVTGEDSERFSLSVFFTGTLTGTFTRWYTDKRLPDTGANDNDWIQDSTFTPTNPAGAAGKFGTPSTLSTSYRWRLKYVNASGTGNIFAYTSVTRVH